MNDQQDTVEEINRAVVELWRRQFGGSAERPLIPLIYPDLRHDALLIVGCNPAAPESEHQKSPVFSDEHLDSFPFEQFQEHETEIKRNHRYFRACERFANKVGLPWEHVDLFFFRETGQNDLKKHVLINSSELTAFGSEQISLSLRLIELARPRAIVVANAFASDLLYKHFGFSELDEDGLHWATVCAKRIPVFLSGMLSGQRQLDKYSNARLVWHVKRTLRIIE